jgi:hypothetical protein
MCVFLSLFDEEIRFSKKVEVTVLNSPWVSLVLIRSLSGSATVICKEQFLPLCNSLHGVICGKVELKQGKERRSSVYLSSGTAQLTFFDVSKERAARDGADDSPLILKLS